MRRSHIVDQISKAFSEKLPQVSVILYGSEARGDARPDSDIDLLVLLPQEKVTYSDRDSVFDVLYDIELKTGIVISPYIISKYQWEHRPFDTPFYLNILREGVQLNIAAEYERRVG